jgi:hypothetical protein
MTNSFLTAQEIARQSLLILRDNLVFPMLAYRDCSQDFAKKGDTIQVKKPPVYQADEFNGSINPQAIEEENVLVTLDKIADVSVEVTAKEMALNLSSFTEQVITPAAIAIAEKINSDGLKLYKDIPYTVGAAGTTPDGLDDFANIRKSLNLRKAPVSQRFAVWDPEADCKFSVLEAIVSAEKSGSTVALREGSIGRIQGIDNYMSQAVPDHIKGTLAASAGNIVLKTAVAADSAVTEITLTKTASNSLSGTLLKGDILTFADCEGQYAVTTGATAADNEITVSVYPAINEAITTSKACTVVAGHTANLAFHKNAFAFVTRPLELARGVESYVTNFEGLSLRVTFSYDATYKKQMLSIDTLYGFKTLYPELAVRVLG